MVSSQHFVTKRWKTLRYASSVIFPRVCICVRVFAISAVFLTIMDIVLFYYVLARLLKYLLLEWW